MDLNRFLRAVLVCTMIVGPLACLALEQQAFQATKATTNSTTTTVQTSSGLLQGIETKPNHSGYQSVIKFLGVPYAQAPIGERRFKRPVELLEEQAKETLDATRFGKTCPQHRHLTRFISPLLNLDQSHQISEDCLHLNIFMPTPAPSNQRPEEQQQQAAQLPVIVWIPGEGFDFADARQFDGSQLALRTNSIVVTVQYRVGVLGLLDAPQLGLQGNQAIHDQLMALKWVQKNIRAFGGDRDQVTVMGRFSGGMSISTMLTAPNQELVMRSEEDTNKGQPPKALFSRAVLVSGIAVDDWIIVDNQRSKFEQLLRDASKRGLCKIGINGTSSELDQLNCLQSMPVEQLMEISGYQWRLVRDNQLISHEGGPIEALRQRQLPAGVEAVLLGETGTEGTLCLYRHMLMANLNERAALIEQNQLTGDHLNELIRDDLATYFQYNNSHSSQALETALDTLVDTTTTTTSAQDQQQNRHQLRQRYLDACSSYMVKSHNLRFKRHLAQQVSSSEPQAPTNNNLKLYHYQLNYKPSFSLAPDYIKTAAHGDDIPLIFGLVYNEPASSAINQADLAMTQKMLAYIGNFVHGDDPQSKQTILRGSGAERNKINEDEEPKQQEAHLLDLSGADQAQTEVEIGRASVQTTKRQAPLVGNSPATTSQVAKLIIVESPTYPVVDEQVQQRHPKQHALVEIKQQQQQVADGEPLGGQLTRSQKLLELHRQQMLDDGLWLQSRAQLFGPIGAGQQRRSDDNHHLSTATETSLATVLLLTASIVILALMSVCVVLSVLVVRYNALSRSQDVGGPMGGASKRSQQFNSSSSCNICDDSQGGSIDAVLNQQASAKKNEHAFCNVFAKLRNQHHRTAQHNNNNHATARAQTNGGSEPQVPIAAAATTAVNGQQQASANVA